MNTDRDEQQGGALLPQTTYKNKRVASDDERFRLNTELNTYLFNNCDHEHDGYPNHLACRPCVLDCLAFIDSRASVAAPQEDAQIDPVNTYPTVIESVQLLEAAGFGAPGKPNTLLAMVKEAIAAAASSPLPAEPAQPQGQQPVCVHCDPSFTPCGPDEWCQCQCHVAATAPAQPEGEQEYESFTVELSKPTEVRVGSAIGLNCPDDQTRLHKVLAVRDKGDYIEADVELLLKPAAATPPDTPSDAAMRAAEEIADMAEKYMSAASVNNMSTISLPAPTPERIAAIITRYFPANTSPSSETAVGGVDYRVLFDGAAREIHEYQHPSMSFESCDAMRCKMAKRLLSAAPVAAAGDDEGERMRAAFQDAKASLDPEGKWTAGDVSNLSALFFAGWNAHNQKEK